MYCCVTNDLGPRSKADECLDPKEGIEGLEKQGKSNLKWNRESLRLFLQENGIPEANLYTVTALDTMARLLTDKAAQLRYSLDVNRTRLFCELHIAECIVQDDANHVLVNVTNMKSPAVFKPEGQIYAQLANNIEKKFDCAVTQEHCIKIVMDQPKKKYAFTSYKHAIWPGLQLISNTIVYFCRASKKEVNRGMSVGQQPRKQFRPGDDANGL